MKISGVTVWQLDLPLHKPYWLHGNKLKFECLDSTIVRIETDTGIVGWGEGCPWGSSYLPAHGRGIRAAFEELVPAILGCDPRQLDALNRTMDHALPGHLYAKSALDIAAWDIAARAAGVPLCEMLGAREAHRVPIASSISNSSPDSMLAEINDYRAKGYRVHSCKIGSGVDSDIECINALWAERHEDETIYFDSNRAWSSREAITVINAADRIQTWYEQPCETLTETAQVHTQTNAVLCIDESLHTFEDMLRIQHEQIAEMVNIKINRVGGLTKGRRMRDFCLASGMTMLVMDTGGSVIADTAAAHFAQSIPSQYCLGSWSCQDMVSVDPAPGQGARNRTGCFDLPDSIGLGIEPDAEVLGAPVAQYRI
ncbi:MAG: mandelate racemase/muconate lactonizing enzyme family protein [Pseudomonadota bacterium]